MKIWDSWKQIIIFVIWHPLKFTKSITFCRIRSNICNKNTLSDLWKALYFCFTRKDCKHNSETNVWFCITLVYFYSLQARYILPVSRQICCFYKSVLKWYVHICWTCTAIRMGTQEQIDLTECKRRPQFTLSIFHISSDSQQLVEKRCILKDKLRCGAVSPIYNENQWIGSGCEHFKFICERLVGAIYISPPSAVRRVLSPWMDI